MERASTAFTAKLIGIATTLINRLVSEREPSGDEIEANIGLVNLRITTTIICYGQSLLAFRKHAFQSHPDQQRLLSVRRDPSLF
jgi:hypothetical protein